MDICDPLKDIIKHTHGLGFIDMLKLIGTDTDAKIEAMDVDKSVIMYGTMYQPITGLNSTVGLSQLGVLRGFLDYSKSYDKSTVSVISQARSGVDTLTGIEFNANGNKSTYRFMAENVVNEQIKVPPFKGAVWHAVVKPTKPALSDLVFFANTLGSFESTFVVSTENGCLMFNIGTGATNRTTLKFADNVQHVLKQWAYPLSQVLSILKLNQTSDCTMSFSDMGALKIDIDSGMGLYSYILPARQQ